MYRVIDSKICFFFKDVELVDLVVVVKFVLGVYIVILLVVFVVRFCYCWYVILYLFKGNSFIVC